MIGEQARAEDLFPAAADLFMQPERRAGGPVRWVAGLIVLGVAVLVGRAVVGWMNRNL
jgi:hypothetical protein